MASVRQFAHDDDGSFEEITESLVAQVKTFWEATPHRTKLAILFLLWAYFRFSHQEVVIEPRKSPLFFLTLVLPRANRVRVIGDIKEEYAELYVGCGKRNADLWVWSCVARELWPQAKKLGQWLVAAGVLALVVVVWKRWMGGGA